MYTKANAMWVCTNVTSIYLMQLGYMVLIYIYIYIGIYIGIKEHISWE
jgi:hypothetical protein